VISEQQAETSFWISCTKRQLKLVKTISAHSESSVSIFRLFKQKYSSRDTIPLKASQFTYNKYCLSLGERQL
jgi:hypothetical protein